MRVERRRLKPFGRVGETSQSKGRVEGLLEDGFDDNAVIEDFSLGDLAKSTLDHNALWGGNGFPVDEPWGRRGTRIGAH